MYQLTETDLGKIKSYILGYYKTEGNNFRLAIKQEQIMPIIDELTDGRTQDSSTKELFQAVKDLHQTLYNQKRLKSHNGYFKTIIN